MSLRSSLNALSFVFAGTAIFISGCLCAIGFFVSRDCGPIWEYYGCKTPAAIEPVVRPESVPSGAPISGRQSRTTVLAPHPKIRVGVGVHGPTWPRSGERLGGASSMGLTSFSLFSCSLWSMIRLAFREVWKACSREGEI